VAIPNCTEEHSVTFLWYRCAKRHFFRLFVSKDLKRAPPFFLAVKKKVTKEKLSAAPASTFCCAFTSGVVAEPDDADFCG
jgi:hypothetical protein